MPKLQTLSNGLTLLTAPMPGVKTTTVLVMVATGSKYENRKTNGLSHFLEHMFFKGTAKRPTALAISSLLDSAGGEYNAFTSKEYTGYWAKAASSQAGLALDVISDMLTGSLFSQEEIDRERGVIIEEINMYLDRPINRVGDVFETCLYGDTPAGWEVIGPKENITAFSRKDFVEYFKSQYRTGNTIVVIAGDVPKNAPKLVEKHFSTYTKGRAKPKLVVVEKQSAPAIKIEFKKTDQAHLCLGFRTEAYGGADAYPLRVMASLLGGPMSSRLFINLRERNGLCYYVSSNAESMTDSGYFMTQTGVTVAKIEQAIKIIVAEYKRLAAEPVSPAELKRVKQYMAGRVVLGLEGSEDIANLYGQQVVLQMQQKGRSRPLTTPAEHIRKLKAVTAADIQRVAKKYLDPKRLNLAIIGPYKDAEKFKKLLK